MYDTEKDVAYCVVQLGAEICGHVRILHGGIMSTLCDEVFTAAVYGLKRGKVLGGGPAVTANLTINFRKVRAAT